MMPGSPVLSSLDTHRLVNSVTRKLTSNPVMNNWLILTSSLTVFVQLIAGGDIATSITGHRYTELLH